MTPRTWLLLSWILVGAAMIVAHVVLVWRVLRSESLPGKQRWWALVPAVAPYLAYKDGQRVGLVVWAVLVLSYVVLRFLEG